MCRWWIPLYGPLIWLEYLQDAIMGVMDHGGVDAAGCLDLPIVQLGRLLSKAGRIGFLIVAAVLSAFCHLERASLNWHIVSCDSEEKSIAVLATWCSPQRYIYPRYLTICELSDSLSFRQNCLLQIWTQKSTSSCSPHHLLMSTFSHTCADWKQTADLLYRVSVFHTPGHCWQLVGDMIEGAI